MKTIYLTLLVLLVAESASFAQQLPKSPNKTNAAGQREGEWIIWYTKDWNVTQQPDSTLYYRRITYRNDKPVGSVKDYYKSGKVQWEGLLLTDRPEEVMEGKGIWYYENGSKEVEREFKEGKMLSEVKYNPDGTRQVPAKGWAALNQQGEQYYEKGEYQKALETFEEAKIQADKEFNNTHPDYATALNNLALLYKGMGNYQKAEPLYVQASQITEKVFGKSHPEFALSLNNLAALYFSQGNYPKAEPLFVEALQIREKSFGKNHPDYALSLNNLAMLYENMGNPQKAEPLYVTALQVQAEVSGKAHPDYALSLNNLATLYFSQGNYQKAEPLFADVLQIREKALGKTHPNYATSLNNLALLYQNMGNYQKAEPLLVEALQINEKVLGRAHPEYANSLNSLAALYVSQSYYQKAEPLFAEALQIRGKALGKVHPSYANSLNNLAYVYKETGKYQKAEQFFLEVVQIIEKALGKAHPFRATGLHNLAGVYVSQGNYPKAEPLFLEALQIAEKALGKVHPDYVGSLQKLADLYRSQGNYQKAQPLLLAANQLLLDQMDKLFPALSESEKGHFYNTLAFRFENFNSFVLLQHKQNPALAAEMFNNQLVTKASLFNATNKVRQHILASHDQALKTRYQQWLDQKNYLAKVYQLSKGEKQRRGIDENKLEEAANDLEKQLSLQSELFATVTDKKRYSWREVQKHLKDGEACLEMVRFRGYNKTWTDTVYYAALIVTPASKLPELVVLDKGKDLEGKYAKFYQNAIRNGLLSRRVNQTLEDSSADSLYHHYWGKISVALKQAESTKVYFSPDGVYNRINLNTLYNPLTGKFILDEVDLELLTSSKDLITRKGKVRAMRNATLFGFPDYSQAVDYSLTLASSQRSFSPASYLKVDSLKRSLKDGTLDMLQGTEKEVNTIAQLLSEKRIQVNKFTKSQASEAALKNLDNPGILHLATHGFFTSDVAMEKDNDSFKNAGNKKLPENPLLRSGLYLAGAQQALDGKVNSDSTENGILTAYEAMTLNLERTDLVVLSACETGLGEIKNGEGVYGLQRAFQTAGAKAVLMSLWKVSDTATQELMSLFYEQWLRTQNKRKAFKLAQQSIRVKYADPYYWGAFVLVGE